MHTHQHTDWSSSFKTFTFYETTFFYLYCNGLTGGTIWLWRLNRDHETTKDCTPLKQSLVVCMCVHVHLPAYTPIFMYVCMCVHVVHVYRMTGSDQLVEKKLKTMWSTRWEPRGANITYFSICFAAFIVTTQVLSMFVFDGSMAVMGVYRMYQCTKSFHCLDNSHIQVLASRSVLWFCVLIQQQNSHVVTHLDIQFRCGASIFDGSTVIGQCCFLLGSKINKVLVYTHCTV